MKIVIYLITIFFGKKVGKDEFKNIYYTSRINIFGKKRRWVIYKGISEPSKIPPHWEIWLRHLDVSLESIDGYMPNITETKYVKFPQIIERSYNNYQPFKE